MAANKKVESMRWTVVHDADRGEQCVAMDERDTIPEAMTEDRDAHLPNLACLIVETGRAHLYGPADVPHQVQRRASFVLHRQQDAAECLQQLLRYTGLGQRYAGASALRWCIRWCTRSTLVHPLVHPLRSSDELRRCILSTLQPRRSRLAPRLA